MEWKSTVFFNVGVFFLLRFSFISLVSFFFFFIFKLFSNFAAMELVIMVFTLACRNV